VHGVGVYAIRDIPKGTYVFGGDEDEMVWVKASSTKRLDKEIRKLATTSAFRGTGCMAVLRTSTC